MVARRFRQRLELAVALRDVRHPNLNTLTVWRINILVVCLHEDASTLNDQDMYVSADSIAGMVGQSTRD
jgi:hypothetical protein